MSEGGAPGFKGSSYGWKSVTTLAKQTDNNAQKSPFRNADTMALFASGESPRESPKICCGIVLLTWTQV